MIRILAACAVACIASLPVRAAASATGDVRQLDPADYQSFVRNWVPETVPLCAAIASADAWDHVLHPAPTMGRTRPFAPASAFWNDHAILLLAKVVNAGDVSHVFRLVGVERTRDAIEVNYGFRPTPPASSTMKWYFAIAVAKPLPALVRFRQEGKIVCALNTGAGEWTTPMMR